MLLPAGTRKLCRYRVEVHLSEEGELNLRTGFAPGLHAH